MAYLAANSPVYNPPLPYRGQVPGGMQDGHCLVVSGTVDPNPQGMGFRVDFSRGAPHGSDTIFVINPRFSQREVVRNTCTSGNWGPEEKHGGFPFVPGQPFEMKIEVTSSCYRVFVNNNYFCDYNHRSSMQMADCISVEGSLHVNNLTLHQRARVRASNTPLPFVATYPGGLQNGTTVLVRGMVNASGPQQFRIDLTCGMHQGADVAYVFNPRFYQNEVVRNTCTRGQWGPEEKHGGFPFYPGQQFEIKIDVTYQNYRMTVNGQHFPEYNHRYQPMNCIDSIKVEGDVQIHEVMVQ